MLAFRPFSDGDWSGYSGAGEDAEIASTPYADFIISRDTEGGRPELWLATIHPYPDAGGMLPDEWASVTTDTRLAAVTLCRLAADLLTGENDPLPGAFLVGFNVYP